MAVNLTTIDGGCNFDVVPFVNLCSKDMEATESKHLESRYTPIRSSQHYRNVNHLWMARFHLRHKLTAFSSNMRKNLSYCIRFGWVGFILEWGARRMMASVDETDRAILSALRDNSRQAFVELAKVVGVSERTIRTRVRRLEEDGIIRGYTIRETGIGLTALIRMKVGPGVEIGSLAGEFANWPGVESSTKSAVRLIWWHGM